MSDKLYKPRYNADELYEIADLICTDHPGETGMGARCPLPSVVRGIREGAHTASRHLGNFVEPRALKYCILKGYKEEQKIVQESYSSMCPGSRVRGPEYSPSEIDSMEALMCPFEEVPLHMGNDSITEHIVRWRLEHGV